MFPVSSIVNLPQRKKEPRFPRECTTVPPVSIFNVIFGTQKESGCKGPDINVPELPKRKVTVITK